MGDIIDFNRDKDGNVVPQKANSTDLERESGEAGLVVHLPKGKPNVKARACAAMILRGMDFDEAAEHFQYASAAEARRAYESVIAESVDSSKDYSAARAKQTLRLEGLLKRSMNDALDEFNPDWIGAGRFSLSLIDRIAKLHGLDAPQRIEVYSPGAEEFDGVLAALMQKTELDAPAEADIFELGTAPDVEKDDSDE